MLTWLWRRERRGRQRTQAPSRERYQKTAPIRKGVFTVALGDIEWDRRRCPVQLVFDFTDSHRAFQEHREPSNESDCLSIDFQAFVFELAFLRHGHEIQRLIFLLLVILFRILLLLLILLLLRDS